jgi:mannan endo-1,4-beta-mannosidase
MYLNKVLTIIFFCFSTVSYAQLKNIKPVSANASPEAQALLNYFQKISGIYTLSGQHNFPLAGDRNTQFASNYIGKTPAVWSQDFGFAAPDDKDSYKARPLIIKEAIRQHQSGSIITFCWHAVPPTAKEPITFQPLPGYDTNALASVQGKLLDAQFKDLLTPGTLIYTRWMEQVDTIAYYLKQLQDAHVPVLWRPYHEMNGNWFWWGGRWEGKYTTAALYRQIFDRLVNYHHLNNLVWIWSIDRPGVPGREFDKYYPGNEYLDILAIDIYGNDFNQKYYDGLLALSNGKPVVLGEVGNPPANEILEKQPNWAYWVIWSGMVRGSSRSDFEKIASNPRVLFKEDGAYIQSMSEYRSACNLALLSLPKVDDFSGEWTLNEYESKMDGSGFGGPAYKLSIIQSDNILKLKSMTQQEWTDDVISEQSLTLDGKDNNSLVFNNSPRVQKLNYSTNRDSLIIDSKTTFNFGGRSKEMTGKDIWILKRKGQKLIISQTLNSPRGLRTSTLVYDKK